MLRKNDIAIVPTLKASVPQSKRRNRQFYLYRYRYCRGKQILLLFLFFFVLFGFAVEAAEYVPGEVIVKFKEEVSPVEPPPSLQVLGSKWMAKRVEPVFKKHKEKKGVKILGKPSKKVPDLSRIYKYVFSKDAELKEIIKEFKKDPRVEYAEPNYIFYLSQVPNDTYYGDQWGLPKINAPQAWDLNTGSGEVIIAVIDTGVDYDHPDLAANIWINTGEIASNSTDDDSNGFIDDLRGWSFVTPESNDPMDDAGHGTEVAGIAGAVGNNSQGVAGVCWTIKLMPIKTFYAQGTGEATDSAEGIVYAVDNGAKIINMSWGGPNNSQTLKNAITYASTQECVLIAAAGNVGADKVDYPAAYSEVIAVAATSSDDSKASFSNYHASVEVSAPGLAIYSTTWNNSYAYNNGTSMSAPFVSGLAGLIRSQSPAMSATQVRTQLKNSADDIDSLNPSYVGKLGSGRINAYQALDPPLAIISSPSAEAVVRSVVAITGTATNSAVSPFASFVVEYGGGSSPSSWTQIGSSHSQAVTNGTLESWDTQNLGGVYTLRLSVNDQAGRMARTLVAVIVDNDAPVISNVTVNGVSVFSWDIIPASPYIEATVTDNSSIQEVRLFVDNDQKSIPTQQGLSWQIAYPVAAPLSAGGNHSIRLEAIDSSEAISTFEVNNLSVLSANQPSLTSSPLGGPSPFSPATGQSVRLTYILNISADIIFNLYDLGGNVIWRRTYSAGQNGGKAGYNEVEWNGLSDFNELAGNGVYVYEVISLSGGQKKVLGKGKIVILN